MTPESSTPPAAAPAAARPVAPSSNWSVLAFIVAVGAVVISAITWFQMVRTVDDLKSALAAQSATGPSIDIADAPTLGPDTATVALVEFSDYECPFCIRHFQQTMPRLMATYVTPGRMVYAFRDWPVDELHPQSIRAHEAAHCALEQHKFWEIHPRLFGPPGSHTPELLTNLAKDVGLDMAAFSHCIDARRSDPGIRRTSEMAIDLGATGTPAFFVGLRDRRTNTVHVIQPLSGAQPFEVFAKAIDAALARAR